MKHKNKTSGMLERSLQNNMKKKRRLKSYTKKWPRQNRYDEGKI